MDLIVEEGEYSPPEPYQNLKYGIRKIQLAYLDYKWNGLEEERLEMLRQWIRRAQDLLDQAAAQKCSSRRKCNKPNNHHNKFP